MIGNVGFRTTGGNRRIRKKSYAKLTVFLSGDRESENFAKLVKNY